MLLALLRTALVALLVLVCAPHATVFAQTTPPPGAKAVKMPPLSKTPLHAEYVVTVNGKGQVVRIVSKKISKMNRFDLLTYGNAVQTYIRTDSGRVVVGTFRLAYDYDPKHDAIKRDVALVSRGGVDPSAPSAVAVMEKKARDYSKRDADALRKYLAKHPQAARTPVPAGTGTSPPLPAMQNIVGPSASPAH